MNFVAIEYSLVKCTIHHHSGRLGCGDSSAHRIMLYPYSLHIAV